MRPKYAGESKVSCFVSMEMQEQSPRVVDAQSDDSLGSMLERMWEMESEGFAASKLQPSVQDKHVLSLWDARCEFTGGHFQLPIPWKPRVNVPNNESVALSRLHGLKKSLDRRGLFERYDAEIRKLLDQGYAEPLSDHNGTIDYNDGLTQDHNGLLKLWYLPHHAVLNPKKPGKLRVVFYCAARYAGESLNDKCFSGPDLTNHLLHVLVRFREGIFAFGGDIEAMYHQVVIPVEERDALRFLWFDESGNVVSYRMTRHVFGGIWCSSSSTYAMRKSVVFNESENFDAVNFVICRSFYVDDCLHSMDSEEDLICVALGVKETLKRGGFKLTKFIGNSPSLLRSLPEDEIVSGGKDFCPDSKVLGVRWNVGKDEFHFQNELQCEEEPTRRKILRLVASIFDPLGLLTPFTVKGKKILQETVRLKLGWDESLPGYLVKSWKRWLNDISRVLVSEASFPRCIKPFPVSDCVCELHHFSDASEEALGCCSYLRCIHRSGLIHVALVCSRSKVAPIRKVSVPRLELEAAVMSDMTLRSEMSIDLGASFFWVDSEIVLKYIGNESRRFMTFVANRVSLIHSATRPEQWRHVSSENNVADVITRGLSKWEDRWVWGPSFLKQYHSEWRSEVIDSAIDDDPELKKTICSMNTAVGETNEVHPIDKLCGYYSSWFALKKAVAWLLRVQHRLRGKRHESDSLTTSELQRAEVCILKHVQGTHYAKDIDRLYDSKPLTHSSSIRRLDPFVDSDGLLRVGGRLRRSSAHGVGVHPVIIPHKHVVAEVITRHYHNISHLGTEWVVSRLRERFWITNIRGVVKRVAFACPTCKRFFAAPLKQKMADLPTQRLVPFESPFTITGVDCFGPFMVKRARTEVKRYGCLFCCFSTRAIHLELLDSLETDSFLNAFRRFVARRGMPREVWSDNGTNFVGADRAMFRVKEDDIQKYALANNVSWHFLPPHASHMGGIWERLIRTVRKVLVGMMPHSTRVTDESLRTILCEAERIVNSRPLTKVSEDIKDVAALTPNHFLMIGCTKGQLPLAPCMFNERDVYRKQWRSVQHLVDQFWVRWLKEYLPELGRRNKWQDAQRSLKVGDLVLVEHENTPRGVWPLGLVVSVKQSADGLVRSAKLRLKNQSEIERPIHKCVLLGVL